MKTKLINLMICGLLLLSVSACKDDTKEPTPAKTKTDHLTSSSWKVTAAMSDPAITIGTTKITDLYTQFMEDCDKDDFEKYESNGTGIFDAGAKKCDASEPQKDAFVWSFTSGETKLIADGDTSDIEQLDETTMKQSFIIDDEDGDYGTAGLKYKWTITYKH